MGYLVLARKYRPQKFSEVYAQEQVTDILDRAIKIDHIAHAYLFTGPRGVGKTSMARIFAKSLNCITNGPSSEPCNKCSNCVEITKSTSTDVVEIDGASHTGVDDIRDLQKELMYTTSNSKYKIYIIDEVHMLSTNAFNALLKTLEEPPDNVIFIFATTVPQKVLPTIISRCQRYDFKRIPLLPIVKRLQTICVSEKIKISDEGLYFIARKADGGMRDALSLLDIVLSLGKKDIETEDILSIFGIVNNDIYFEFLKLIQQRNAPGLLGIIHQILEKGYDLQEFLSGILEWIRNTLLTKINVKSSEIPPSLIEEFKNIASKFSENELVYLLQILIQTKMDMKSSENQLLVAELAIIKISKISEMQTVEEILTKLSTVGLSKETPQNNLPKIPQKNENVKQDIVNIKKQIVSSAHLEKPSEFNLTTYQNEKEAIEKKIAKEMPYGSKFFLRAKLMNIVNNSAHFVVGTDLSYKHLLKNSATISSILSKHYDLNIRVHFKYEKKEKAKIIKNPTIQEIQKLSPMLAEFIEKTDSIIGS